MGTHKKDNTSSKLPLRSRAASPAPRLDLAGHQGQTDDVTSAGSDDHELEDVPGVGAAEEEVAVGLGHDLKMEILFYL